MGSLSRYVNPTSIEKSSRLRRMSIELCDAREVLFEGQDHQLLQLPYVHPTLSVIQNADSACAAD